MIGKEVIIWLDQRWYDAINKHLKDETLEEHLEEVIDQLCNQLPEHEYERISHEIWQEDQENKLAQEAARRFAVFHVTEGHNSTYFVAEENIEMLQVAARLRSYLRKPPENNPTRFAGMFSRGEKISLEQYNTYVQERLENTGRVTGAFDIDLDVGRFDALHIMDGWQCFNTKDVTAAAYFAMKKSGISIDERWKKFLDRLDGKQIMHETEPGFLTGSRMLRPKEICFSEDIVQNGKLLEFCMDGAIDVDQMFGTHTCDYDNGDWFNIYANYDMVQKAEESRQYELAAEGHHILADLGRTESQKKFAALLERGDIVARNLDAAMEYYYMAAEKNDSHAAFRYSRLAERTSDKAAYFWLAYAAALGCVESYPAFAERCAREGDDELANYYYALSAAYDDTDSIVTLAKRYYNGTGTEQNLPYAKWYMDKLSLPPIYLLYYV